MNREGGKNELVKNKVSNNVNKRKSTENEQRNKKKKLNKSDDEVDEISKPNKNSIMNENYIIEEQDFENFMINIRKTLLSDTDKEKKYETITK